MQLLLVELGAEFRMSAARPADLTLAQPLRAGSFIVTLFGDVVAPRGGDVWIGNIIEFCAPFGISETLIRTAMSRLVAAGQLTGVRKGRRSFYRLTEAARHEYAEAANIIFSPASATEWQLVFSPRGQMGLPRHLDFVALNDSFALGPSDGCVPDECCTLAGQFTGGAEALYQMARTVWALDVLEQDCARFLGLAARIRELGPLPGDQALEARVLLVHAFRQIALRDPRLPVAVFPPDWAGFRARQSFARVYLDLSLSADSHVAENFAGANGPLRDLSQDGIGRYRALQESAAG